MSQEIDNIKKQIISRLNLRAEFESFGIKMIGKPTAKGFVKCPSPFNADKFPSCGVNINNSSSFAGMLRIFNNSGPRQAISFFDLARELSPAHSGKDFIEILKLYSEKTGVEFLKNNSTSKKDIGKIVATYEYIDSNDFLVCQVCRFEKLGVKGKKTFRQRHPIVSVKMNKSNELPVKIRWKWGLGDVVSVPYKLNNIINNDLIYYVEGEKCVEALIDFGFSAFTFLGGAKNWKPEVLPYFKGKDIILIPDNDDVGKESVKQLVRELNGTANSTKIVELPGLKKPKDDIVEWIEYGGTKGELLKLCKSAKDTNIGKDPIDELNKRHAVVTVGGKVRILDETISIKGIHNVDFLSKYDFYTKYENRKVVNPLAGQKGQSKHIPLANAWLNSPKRREYEGVVFEPQLNDSSFYNLYQNLAFLPVKGDWSKYKKHLKDNICNGDMQYYDWLLAWMARIVQNPGGKKPGTAIVLRGEKGVGKGVFVEIFGKIFGNHFQLITNAKQATGRFNSSLKNCILLYLDEAFYAGDKSSDGVLKGLITSDQHNIELKGKDTFQMSNHVNCIIASNNDWVISAGSNERRYFVLDVAQVHMQDHQYFRAIDDQMYKHGGIAAMLYELLTLDISNYNLRDAPKTVGLTDQIILGFRSFRKFWFELLYSDFNFDNIDGILTTKFYDKYIDYCDKINEKYKHTHAVFGKKLVYYSKVRTEKKRFGGGNRSNFYFFNDRDSCRKYFEKIVKTKFDWKINKDEIDKI